MTDTAGAMANPHGSDAATRASEVLTAYEAAFNTNDAAAMNALFSEDASFVNFSGRLVIDRDALRRAQEFVFLDGGPLAAVSVRYEVEHIVTLNAHTVLLHARQRSESTTAPDPMAAVFSLLLVEDDAGRWTIRMGQNTPATD